MSSVYDDILMSRCGVGMSCKYRLNSVGERTEHCGTPFGMFRVADDIPL